MNTALFNPKSNPDILRIKGAREHNLQNINAARLVCNQLEISNNKFYQAIKEFKGLSIIFFWVSLLSRVF